jgi:outer membrane protein assembly factor BamB
MKKSILILLILFLVFSSSRFTYSEVNQKLPKGFTRAETQLNILFSCNEQVYYILTLQDSKTRQEGYLFLDTENIPLLDINRYQTLAQNAYFKDHEEQIKKLINFPISRDNFITITKSSLGNKTAKLTDHEKNLIQPSLRQFCLEGENLLLYTLLDSGKLLEKTDPILYFGTMKWALRRSAWQNYWQAQERLSSALFTREKSTKILECIDKTEFQRRKQDLLDTLFFGNLYLTLSDRSQEENLWQPLYKMLEPEFNKNAISFSSQFSEILFRILNNPIEINPLNSTFILSIQSYLKFIEEFEKTTNPELEDSIAQKILQAYVSKDAIMFRINPKRTGKSSFIGPKRATLLWKVKLGDWIASSPVVLADQSLLIGCFDGNLYHLSPNGDILWKFYAGSWIVSTPAVNQDGMIYFGNQNGFFYSLYPDGKLNWKINLGSMIGSSPTISLTGDVLFGDFNGSLVCIKQEGKIRWKYQTGSSILSSPAILDTGNLVFGSTDNHIYCLTPDGDLVWKYKTNGMIVGSPAIDGKGRILIGSLDNHFYCLQSDGSLVWDYLCQSWIISSPAIDNNNQIYFAEKKGIVYCLTEFGSVVWKYSVEGVIEGSPLLDKNDTLFITSWDRNLYAIQKGELLWKYRFESESRSTPALSKNGTLYAGAEDSFIYAFQNKP